MDVDKLKAAGVDYEDGLARFSNNAQIYEKYLRKLVDQNQYTEMKDAIDAGDVEAAFQAAHKLKAFMGNLSITELYHNVAEVTEIFRAGSFDGSQPYVEQMDRQMEEIIQAITEE